MGYYLGMIWRFNTSSSFIKSEGSWIGERKQYQAKEFNTGTRFEKDCRAAGNNPIWIGHGNYTGWKGAAD
jgi:hypothetical protein